jgi:hypothetical protein
MRRRRFMLGEFWHAGRFVGIVRAGYGFREWANLTALYVAKVISGTNIQDLPVAHAKHQRIFVNLKTAKLLGLHIGDSVIQRAYLTFSQ